MKNEILAKTYEPEKVEQKWYEYWEVNGLFTAKDHAEAPFCIVIPPPNVTGTLHMGHALNNTLQDILCRYKRMKGFDVLWQPGTDHAGIATQNVVEKDLAQCGTNRHETGRDKFVERVWEWKKKYGSIIINQLKRLGCSCDWSRERFTMDEGLSRAVKEVFVTLYETGLIYRGDYIINWCPRCHTALADLEVEHEEVDSFLYHIRYHFENKNGHLIVATTRPETLLGDSAVAVNPDDIRYSDLSGEKVILPILNKPLPIIFDKYVDSSFGTGVLKVTPAHDPNDFKIGDIHNLERIKVIDEHGKMNELAGPYKGLDRFDCRDKIVEDLTKANLIEKIEPYKNAVGHCYRCKTVIEPILSKQWFVEVKPLAEKASEAVKTGKTRIYPVTWENSYFEWMNNIKDWCISRQIWWGHRIPAWYCKECGEINVEKKPPQRCKTCNCTDLEQETDVLDTWFSSALWPFSTLGWPDTTPELETYYPTSVLITGFDILFFWVARMMMMGLNFMKDVPFRDVYIHALVRDADGQKMSKSKGNVIDPLTIMDKFGTDSLRFTLAALAAQGRDIKLSEERVDGYRHFVNKIWNASRFVLMNLDEDIETDYKHRELSLPDRWVLTRLGQISIAISSALDEYRFNDAAGFAYQFIWHEFCDWYLEMSKINLYGDNKEKKKSTQAVLNEVLTASLKLLHPFMPFVTEEIWQKMPFTDNSIMTSGFPEADSFIDDKTAIKEMSLIMGIITGIRNIRGEMSIPPGQSLNIQIDISKGLESDTLEQNISYIKTLAKIKSHKIASGISKPEASATAVVGEIQVHVLLKGMLDFKEETKRLKKKIDKIQKEIEISGKKLSNQGFIEKAPQEIIEEVKAKMEYLSQEIIKLNQNLSFFEAIND